jgi:hypothetical protein
MTFECKKNDPEEMAVARDASWLCAFFQEHKFSAKEKKEFITSLLEDFKNKEKYYG